MNWLQAARSDSTFAEFHSHFCFMPAAPRMRQLRRDKTVFNLVMNIIRIYLEEDSLLTQQPHLREAPDASLLYLQQVADQWLSLATAYVVRKHRCSMTAAIQLIAELQVELRAVIPEAEIRAVPLEAVLNLSGLPAAQ